MYCSCFYAFKQERLPPYDEFKGSGVREILFLEEHYDLNQ